MLEEVDKLYRRIFGKDPLLLRRRNQKSFGDQILRNLLVERALKSKKRKPVALDDPKSRNDFKAVPGLPETGPGDRLKSRYDQSRRTRSTLSKSEQNALQQVTMLARGELTAERRLHAYADHRIAQRALKDSFDRRLRIAAISYRVTISRIPGEGYLGEELCPLPPVLDEKSLTRFPERKATQKMRRTEILTEPAQSSWGDTIKRHVDTALTRESHIVLLPEFGLPPEHLEGETPIDETIKEVCRKYTHPFFLFSGSRHEGAYNRGFILTRTRGKPLARQWWHYKLASARSLGENIMGPQNPTIPSYKFKLPSPSGAGPGLEYEIFVAICVDVFDTSTFINYVVACVEAKKNRYKTIILVPSFNPSSGFLHALRDLSFIAQCPVVYVNGLHGDAELFLYGLAVGDLTPLAKATAGTLKKTPIMASFRKAKKIMTTRRNELHKDSRRLEKQRTENKFEPPLLTIVEQSAQRWDQDIKKLDEQLQAIDWIQRQLDTHRKSGALKHLITVERCRDCAKPDHGEKEYCASDILYYNLDVELLADLLRFRTWYFNDDSFLPLPFRDENRAAIRQRMLESED
jgi:hypothetical protein